MIVVTASLRNALARRRKALVIRSRFDPGASDVANPMTADGPSVLMPKEPASECMSTPPERTPNSLCNWAFSRLEASKVRMRMRAATAAAPRNTALGVVGKRFRGALHPDAAEIVLVCNRTRRR